MHHWASNASRALLGLIVVAIFGLPDKVMTGMDQLTFANVVFLHRHQERYAEHHPEPTLDEHDARRCVSSVSDLGAPSQLALDSKHDIDRSAHVSPATLWG